LCTEEGVHPRVSMMIGPNHISDLAARGVRSGSGDTGLSLGPVKLVLTETDGAFRPSPDELRAQVWHAHRYGFQVAIHAVEESEICVAAEALAGPAHDDPARHHRIEHCSVLPPGLVEILSEAKVAICTQPGFVFESGDRYLADVEPHLLPFLYGIKSLLDNGIPVGAGSDAPVASFNPLHGIGTSVTRLSRGGQSVAEGEAISVEQALRLYTTGAASICREQDRKGSIAPGKLADMVILSDEITAVPAEAIRDIRVDATIVGGQIAWERDL
jgi:predicted amidohydrolase YtcJ